MAASRWFQENIPGDFGIWVDGTDGTRQMVNVGVRSVASAPSVSRLEDGETAELPLSIMADANLTRITFNRLSDPARDPDDEVLRVRLFRDDPNMGRQLVYEDELAADLSQHEMPYGDSYALTPAEDETVLLPVNPGVDVGAANYVLQITVLSGGPVASVRDVADDGGMVFSDVSVGLQMTSDRTLTFVDLNFTARPLLPGMATTSLRRQPSGHPAAAIRSSSRSRSTARSARSRSRTWAIPCAMRTRKSCGWC